MAVDPALASAPPVATTRSLLASAQPGDDREAALRKVAEEFEAMALSELFKPLFEGLETEGLGGGGEGERMFRPMLVDSYARGATANGGVGISDAVYRELIRLQGGAPLGPQS